MDVSAGGDILETAFRGVIGLVVVGAVLSWAKEHDPGGPVSVLIDPIAAIASLVLDPSIAILLFAVGAVYAALRDDGF